MDRADRIRRIRFLCRGRATLELDLMLAAADRGLDWAGLSDSVLTGLESILTMEDLDLQEALASATRPAGVEPLSWEALRTAVERGRAGL